MLIEILFSCLLSSCKSHASLLTTFRYLKKNPGCNKNRLLTVKDSLEGIVCLKPQYYLIFFLKVSFDHLKQYLRMSSALLDRIRNFFSLALKYS